MQLILTLANAALFITSALAQINAADVKAAPFCGAIGRPTTAPYWKFAGTALATRERCGQVCSGDARCASFAVGNGVCMHFSTAASTNFVYDTRSSATKYQFFDLACASSTSTCRVLGNDAGKPSFFDLSLKDASLTKCSARCKNSPSCKSFAVGLLTCRLYKSPVAGNLREDSLGLFALWDVSCPLTIPSVAVSPTTSPTTGPAGGSPSDGGATQTLTVTSPVVPSGDSPSLTAIDDSAYPSDDPSFFDTYTYDDDPLPTVTAMGTAPASVGLPHPTDQPDPPCMVDMTSTNSQFRLAGSDFVPFEGKPAVSPTALGPIAAPTSEAQANAMGPAGDYKVPTFYFQKAVGAANGLYDIVLASTPPRYVAKLTNGNVILVDKSYPTVTRLDSSRSVITTLFGITCQGRVTITQNGQQLTWDVSGQTSKIVAGQAAKGVMAVPFRSTSTPTRDTELRSRAERHHRRNLWTEGAAPRCPKMPPDLYSRVRVGARAPEKNGCGPANGIDLVPDFSFGRCCDQHDLDYDDCSKSFEMANKAFGNCMRSDGCNYLNHWYTCLTLPVSSPPTSTRLSLAPVKAETHFMKPIEPDANAPAAAAKICVVEPASTSSKTTITTAEPADVHVPTNPGVRAVVASALLINVATAASISRHTPATAAPAVTNVTQDSATREDASTRPRVNALTAEAASTTTGISATA